MKEKPNREAFIAFMDEHDLTVEAVARLLDRQVVTIQAYRSRAGVDIPSHSFQLLKHLVNANK